MSSSFNLIIYNKKFRKKNSNIYIDADGDFDQELLQNMLEYAKNKKDYGNHILVIENNIEKLKLKVK